MASFYTYIIFSLSSQKYYYGHTSNLQKRISDHNEGLSTYTKKFIPWKLVYYEVFNSRAEAMKREKFFKSIEGYHWLIKNNIIKPRSG